MKCRTSITIDDDVIRAIDLYLSRMTGRTNRSGYINKVLRENTPKLEAEVV